MQGRPAGAAKALRVPGKRVVGPALDAGGVAVDRGVGRVDLSRVEHAAQDQVARQVPEVAFLNGHVVPP